MKVQKRLRAAWNIILGRPTMYRIDITEEGRLDPDIHNMYMYQCSVPWGLFPDDMQRRIVGEHES